MSANGYTKMSDSKQENKPVESKFEITPEHLKSFLDSQPTPTNVLRGICLDKQHDYTVLADWFYHLMLWIGTKRACFISKEGDHYIFTAIFEERLIVVKPTNSNGLEVPNLITISLVPKLLKEYKHPNVSAVICIKLMLNFCNLNDQSINSIIEILDKKNYDLLESGSFFPPALQNIASDDVINKLVSDTFQEIQNPPHSNNIPKDFDYINQILKIVESEDHFISPNTLYANDLTNGNRHAQIKLLTNEMKKFYASSNHETKSFNNTVISIPYTRPSTNNNLQYNQKTKTTNSTRKYKIAALVMSAAGLILGLVFGLRPNKNNVGQSCATPYTESNIDWNKARECTICGDWPFVYYLNINSTQGCLDALMATARNSSEIIEGVARLVTFPGLQNFDFTREDWTRWSTPDWSNLLSHLANNTQGFQLFNLSSVNLFLDAPSIENIQLFSNFLQQVPINTLDLSYQKLGSNGIAILQPGLSAAPALRNLFLTNTQLESEGMHSIRSILTDNPHIKLLHVDNNGIDDGGANILSEGIQNSSLVELNLRNNNNIREVGIQSILQAAETILMRRINLSGINLPSDSLDSVGRSFQFLERIGLSTCSLLSTDLENFFPYLPNSTVSNYDFSGNQIEGWAAAHFLQLLPTNATQSITIYFNGNLIQGYLEDIASGIASAGVNSFGIGNNPIPIKNLIPFVERIIPTLEELDVSNMQAGNRLPLTIANSFRVNAVKIRKIDLSNNQITDAGAIPFFQAASNTTLQEIRLVRNELTGNSLLNLPNNFNTSQIRILDLGNNFINGTSLARFIQQSITPGSNLQTILVSNNPLGDANLELATALITPIRTPDQLAKDVYDASLARQLQQAKSATSLVKLDLIQTGLNSTSLRAICRIAPAAQFLQNNIRLRPDTAGTRGDLSSCTRPSSLIRFNNLQTSSASHRAQPLLQPFFLHFEILSSALHEAAKGLRKSQPIDDERIKCAKSETSKDDFFTDLMGDSEDLPATEDLARLSRNYTPTFFRFAASTIIIS